MFLYGIFQCEIPLASRNPSRSEICLVLIDSMAAAFAEDFDRSSSTSASPSLSRGRSRRSVHLALGGGAVADLLLWRNRSASASVAAAAAVSWILFELVGYSLPSLIANSLLLLFTILFFWAKSAALLNRPLPPLPKLEISQEVVERVSDVSRVWINRVLAVARAISIDRDRKLFLKVILVLWTVAYVGSLFSFLTFVFIGVILSLTLPALYEKFQDPIDDKLVILQSYIIKQYENVLNRTSRKSIKEKKMQ
ncbi:Reticulon-like protein B10 [Apostasia shenzhenica]|uniref:Reticulon-like protein n=1 Tax=Apostasia shenzhenica TaxID=1088818 RepID=A0A2I0A5J4_9ASPA|nr:Reticulon-like protein B10 [Apostasia shenzhenica]